MGVAGAARSLGKPLSANNFLFSPEKQGETWKFSLLSDEAFGILHSVSMPCAGDQDESEQAKFRHYQAVTGGNIGQSAILFGVVGGADFLFTSRAEDVTSQMSSERQKIADYQKQLDEFWALQAKELERRIQHPELVDYALKFVADEQKRQVPVSNMKSLESALADGEAGARILLPQSRRIIAQEIGAVGGRARRPDPLNELIESIVRRRPTITCSELLAKLKALAPGPVLNDVGPDDISYIDASGKPKDVPVSGLKDRLSRVRKQLTK